MSQYQLGIREKMAEATKAAAGNWGKAAEAIRQREEGEANVRRMTRETHLEELRRTCIALAGDGDVDVCAQAAFDAAVVLVKAIDDCFSETKDAVCAVVADILMDDDSGIVGWCSGPTIGEYIDRY